MRCVTLRLVIYGAIRGSAVTAFQRLAVTVSSGYMKFGTRVTECVAVFMKLDRLVAVLPTFSFYFTQSFDDLPVEMWAIVRFYVAQSGQADLDRYGVPKRRQETTILRCITPPPRYKRE